MPWGNVYNNFDFSTFFVFELRARWEHRQTDGRARRVMWPIGQQRNN